MRNFVEPTARNLLRRPLVLGVPFSGLLAVTFVVLGVFIAGGGRSTANGVSLGLGVAGYLALRICSRLLRPGWEEAVVFAFERRVRRKGAKGRSRRPMGTLDLLPSAIEVVPPDLLTETDLLSLKDGLISRMRSLGPGERWTVALRVGGPGAELFEVLASGKWDLSQEDSLDTLSGGLAKDDDQIYSLYRLPVVTDPLWLFGALSSLSGDAVVIASFRGMEPSEIKRRIETARRSNSRGGETVSNIDSEVSFEEASRVLQGLSRGDERVLEASLVVVSSTEQTLDPQLFCKEKNARLSVLSALGVRKRFHRSHAVRLSTACDLLPQIMDPAERGPAILRTPRGYPLYFSPQDPRLEALHWLVVGASGSGKSFFTGLVLKRMIEEGAPMSVLFVDHHRSFRRLVRAQGQSYLEPTTVAEVKHGASGLFDTWNRAGTVSGVELSDLDLSEKKAGVHALLSWVELFLRHRDSTHPLYLVLDECWNFMRDEPVLVQRAFREFRKLNGAVVAITQSLYDFLTDESGQSIFQNAPVRVLLRQGEDVGRYQGVLGLNAVELARVSRLRQEKGVYSECLIKTPFLSRFGRLYPTEEEHALLRTDNLRAELTEATRLATGELKKGVAKWSDLLV